MCPNRYSQYFDENGILRGRGPVCNWAASLPKMWGLTATAPFLSMDGCISRGTSGRMSVWWTLSPWTIGLPGYTCTSPGVGSPSSTVTWSPERPTRPWFDANHVRSSLSFNSHRRILFDRRVSKIGGWTSLRRMKLPASRLADRRGKNFCEVRPVRVLPLLEWDGVLPTLTHSTPAVPNCCWWKGLAPYWSNAPFF